MSNVDQTVTVVVTRKVNSPPLLRRFTIRTSLTIGIRTLLI